MTYPRFTPAQVTTLVALRHAPLVRRLMDYGRPASASGPAVRADCRTIASLKARGLVEVEHDGGSLSARLTTKGRAMIEGGSPA